MLSALELVPLRQVKAFTPRSGPLASRHLRPLPLCLWGCGRLYKGPAQGLAHGRRSGGILMTFFGMSTLPWILGEWKCSGKRFLFAKPSK